MKKGFAGHPKKRAAPQLFTGASTPKKKGFAGPVQSRRIRKTIYGIPCVPTRPAVRLVGL